jgi:hypothetical protein
MHVYGILRCTIYMYVEGHIVFVYNTTTQQKRDKKNANNPKTNTQKIIKRPT